MKASRLLISSALVGGALALTPAAYYGGGCVLLHTSIYCYGGGHYISGQSWPEPLSTILSLDLSSNFSVSTAGSNWKEVTPMGDIAGVPNFLFSMVGVPSRDCFVVNGGLGFNNQVALAYQTMLFNISTQTWTNVDSGNQTQTRQAAMLLGNGDKIYIWGGNSDQYTGAVNESYPSDMRILDLTLGRWSFVPYMNGSATRIEHTATLSSDGKMIYYLGGLVPIQYVDTNNTIQYSLKGIEMSNIMTFDTSTSQWGTVVTPSIATPTQRRLHTAERIPGTNTMLLYGGAQLVGNVPVSDYCYTLDMDTFQWTQRIIPEGGAGARYGHSMVFANNSTLFVLFGVTADSATKSDFGVLDIASWTWVQNFTGLINRTDESNNSTTTAPAGEQNPKSNTGAIAGGVVGGVVGIALIAGVLIFFMRRKKRSPPRESEGANVKMIDHHNDYGSPAGILSGITESTYYKGLSPDRATYGQSPLSPTDTSAEERTTASSPTAVNKPDMFFTSQKMVLQPIKPDGD